MADPNDATPVLRDFTCKQIFHVLITGGGFLISCQLTVN